MYFLFLLFCADRGRRLRPLLLSLAAGALALGLTAVQLVPLAEALPHTWEHTLRSEWYAHATQVHRTGRERPAAGSDVPAVRLREARRRDDAATASPRPGGYAGIALCAAGGRGARRRRPASVRLSDAGAPGRRAGDAGPRGHRRGDRPAPLRHRADELPGLRWCPSRSRCSPPSEPIGSAAGEGLRTFLGASLASLALLLVLAPRFLPGIAQLEPATVRRRVIWEAIALGVGALAVGVAWRRRPRWGAAALLVVLVVSRVGESGDLYPTVPASAFYPSLPILAPVPRDQPVRFVALGQTFLPNVAAFYGIEDARGYESMTFRPLLRDLSALVRAAAGLVQPCRRPGTPLPVVPQRGLRPRAALGDASGRAGGWWRATRAETCSRISACCRGSSCRSASCGEPDRDRRLTVLAGISDFRIHGVLDEPAAAPREAWRPERRGPRHAARIRRSIHGARGRRARASR